MHALSSRQEDLWVSTENPEDEQNQHFGILIQVIIIYAVHWGRTALTLQFQHEIIQASDVTRKWYNQYLDYVEVFTLHFNIIHVFTHIQVEGSRSNRFMSANPAVQVQFPISMQCFICLQSTSVSLYFMSLTWLGNTSVQSTEKWLDKSAFGVTLTWLHGTNLLRSKDLYGLSVSLHIDAGFFHRVYKRDDSHPNVER